MTHDEAACLQPSKLADLLKAQFPFLRSDTLRRVADVVSALIEKQTTNHKLLANGLPGHCTSEAKRKRLSRCLNDVQLETDVFLPLLVSLLPAGKLVMTLDRTNWEHGQTSLNLLVIGVVLADFTLPLAWVALEHGGCSDSATRQRLVARVLRVLPAKRWKALVADREFIGTQWFTFLRKRKIRRVIRLRADSVIDTLRAAVWFDDVLPGELRCLFERGNVYGSVPDNLSYVLSWTAYSGIEEHRPRCTALDTTNDRVRGRHGVRCKQARREGLPSREVLLIDSLGMREHFPSP